MPRRVLQGKIVSDKANKTVTVLVEHRVMHPIYKKIIRKSKKFAAHDENNAHKVGEVVEIIECRPISKSKRWMVVEANAPAAEKKSTAKKAKAGA